MELYMRVSPELNLKRSISGGFRRLCEIGKCYRNEGMDLTHLPELTMWMVMELKGSCKIRYHSNGPENEPIEIDFMPPFSWCGISLRKHVVNPTFIKNYPQII
ncbi:hypothetical protein WN944_004230 [Citrus x changshan-huyou]|uniref:Aminoacyl-tRNA synthetase class II (D/K/N) domain-containing protein n=1 Tax=Citrus x changshan-huyou TaxID=2935761 RepID=A0AAP0M029_9ROSI